MTFKNKKLITSILNFLKRPRTVPAVAEHVECSRPTAYKVVAMLMQDGCVAEIHCEAQPDKRGAVPKRYISTVNED